MANDPLEGREATPIGPGGFEFNRPTVVALIYLASLLTGGLASIAGVVLCYVWRGEAHQPWEATHYTYLARTFWISLIAGVAGVVTAIIGIGILILLAIGVWWVVRCIMSLINAQKREPMPQPETLLF